MPDEALLSSLLTMAAPDANGDVLALRLLSGHGSLETAIAAASAGKLPGGIPWDDHAAVRFRAVIELAARLVRPTLEQRPLLSSHEDLVTYARLRAACSAVQTLRLLFLDRQRQLIADELHRTGSVGDVALYVREIMSRALTMDARGLVIVHSCPSDEPPNPASVRVSCADIQKAGNLLGVELVEYLLIGRRSYVTLLGEPVVKRLARLVAAEGDGATASSEAAVR
ncbi:JAB domain-containing protein [Azospirillum palustre]|nr:JAB domain-containing protein [Azospirillum palustre]